MRRAILLSLLVTGAIYAQAAPAIPPNDVDAILRSFQSVTFRWLTVGQQVAVSLFGLLAAIELGISFGMLAFHHADITEWGAVVVRKFMAIGGFYALLLLGPTLLQAFIDSFVQYGRMASGLPNITASNVAADGIQLILTLVAAAILAGGAASILNCALLVLCCAVVGWAFVKLVKGFVMAQIEAFLCISLGAVMLGFGSSRFTNTYAERYVGAAMAAAIKLCAFYFILAVEQALAPGWIAAAQQGINPLTGIGVVVTMTMSCVIFAAVADPEKLTQIFFNGQLAFGHGDITGAYMPHVNTGMSIGTQALITAGGGVGYGATGALFNSFRGSRSSGSTPAAPMAAAAAAGA